MGHEYDELVFSVQRAARICAFISQGGDRLPGNMTPTYFPLRGGSSLNLTWQRMNV